MELATIEHAPTGPAAKTPPLVIAHGLFGSARNWGAIGRLLARKGRRVVAADMRNHGASPWDDDHTYPALAGDLCELLARLGEPADLLGHSMGGKAAMVAALACPERVRRLVVADIAPVAYSHSQMPAIEAMRSLDLAGVTRRAEAAARLEARLGDPGLATFLVQSLDLSGEAPRWRFNLDALAANMDAILGFPPVEGRFEGPALFLTGAESDYVRPEHRDKIARLFAHPRFVRLKGAGHWLHADSPRAFAEAVDAFLSA